MSKCKGCGLTLQNVDPNESGYTPKLTNKLCERCFKITNYNYHDDGKKIDNEKIVSDINSKNGFNLFMCDLLNLNEQNIDLFNKINNPKYLVITKVDLLSNNIDYARLVTRIKSSYNIDNVCLCSIKNNAGIEDIKHLVNTYQKVVFCGPTSSGKSSLINYLFDYKLTVSSYQNTTQEFISLKNGDLTLIDAPGFYDGGNLEKDGIIKPRTMMIKSGYELVIDDVIISFSKETSCTLFLATCCQIKTRKQRSVLSSNLTIKDNSDLTIKNKGFIYFKNGVTININDLNNYSVRQSIVGGK